MLVKILTPYGKVLEKEAYLVSFRTPEGSMGVLPRRAPIITCLAVSKVKIVSDGDVEEIEVAGGILSCDGKEVVILTEEAGKKEDLDPHRFMRAKERVDRLSQKVKK